VPPQEPIFKAQFDVVTRDVIVRDRKGLFVPDLTPEEFEVYDDGVKQDIISMTVVSGGRATRLFAPPPSRKDIIVPVSQPMSDISGSMFLFFIDDLHMDFHDRDGIPDLFKKLEKNLLHDGDMWGMVSSGLLPNAIDMTPDKNRFDEAVEQMAANPSSPTGVIQAPSGTGGPSEVRYRASRAIRIRLRYPQPSVDGGKECFAFFR
jgi:hypothetical protein